MSTARVSTLIVCIALLSTTRISTVPISNALFPVTKILTMAFTVHGHTHGSQVEIAGDWVPVVFLAHISADLADPQASVDIGFAFDVLVHPSVVAIEGYTFGHPKFFAFPNSDFYTSYSSSAEVLG